jgi:VWFA-related protein
MKATVAIIVAAAVITSAAVLARQSPTTAPPNTIWVTANVMHEDGHLVADLTANDFDITDNGETRAISVFRNDPIPIAISLMVDVSSSMESNYSLVRKAVTALTSHFEQGDRAVIGTFDSLPWISSRFSARPEVLQQSIAAALGGTLDLCDGDWIDKAQTRTWRGGGKQGGFGTVIEFTRRMSQHAGSAIWDGAACGVNAVASDGETPRRIVVLLTDGEDNMSSTKIPQLVARANQAGVMIYAVALMSGYGMAGGDLKGLATATGGGYFYLTGEDAVADAFTRIGDELRHQYVFGFTPSGTLSGPHDIVIASRVSNTTVRSRRVFMDAPENALPAGAARAKAAAAPPADPSLPASLAPAGSPPTPPVSRPPAPPVISNVRTATWDLLDQFIDPAWDVDQAPRMSIAQMRATLSALKRDTPGWIAAAPAANQPARRLAAAAFVLDLLYTQNDPYIWTQNQPAPDFIDWAAGILDDGSPTPEEKLWSFGAIALFERAGVPVPLERFLVRAEKRFPGEERWALARAVAEDLRTWPEERDVQAFHVDPSIVGPLVSRYEAAIALPSVKQEALLRLGYFELRRGHVDEATAKFAAASAAEPDDAIMRFWLHILYGRAFEQANRLDEAIQQYQTALGAVPGATSATSALIGALSKAHHPADAARVAAAALATPAAPVDPWTMYVLPDFRFWPSIIEQLRKVVAR